MFTGDEQAISQMSIRVIAGQQWPEFSLLKKIKMYWNEEGVSGCRSRKK
jgi:hypothetical protein